MAQVKTKSEIVKIKKACEITDAIFEKIILNFRWKTEIELRDFILAEIKKRGLKPSFPPIVTSGARAGNEIHPQPTDNYLSGFTIIDFGVIYQKYMSDMTRTIYIGKPNEKEKEIYKKVLKSKTEAEKFVLPKMKIAFSDLRAREVMGDYNRYFIHTLGHGVGTRIHEAPRIYWKNTKSILKENMIITVEPGIYIPKKFGIRIEDTGVVTKIGFLPLTRSRLDLISFKKIK